MVTNWMRAVAINIIIATACMICVMMDWVPVSSMNAFVATAGAIVQCVARMMGDGVVSCSHDICRSIDETRFNFDYLKIFVVLRLRKAWGVFGSEVIYDS